MRARPLWAMVIALAILVAPSTVKRRPLLAWNVSASVPTGLYWVAHSGPYLRDIAVVRLPPRMAALAVNRGYLPRTAYLLKPVVAARGDQVCRYGGYILIRGVFTAHALPKDRRQRPLPRWQG